MSIISFQFPIWVRYFPLIVNLGKGVKEGFQFPIWVRYIEGLDYRNFSTNMFQFPIWVRYQMREEIKAKLQFQFPIWVRYLE